MLLLFLLKARWIAQLIIASGSVVARAFTQALRNEMQGKVSIKPLAYNIDSPLSKQHVYREITE